MSTQLQNLNLKYLKDIENAVNSSLERIRLHPFIVKGYSKDLTQEQVIRWILCAGRESKSFPKIIENMIEQTDNPSVAKILQENLNDEYGNGNPEHAHFMHYLHLLDNIKVNRQVFDDYQEKVGIKLALSLAYNISTQESQGVALGYMLVNEGMTCITYSSVKSAFAPYYPDIKTPFFDIHIEVDEHHVDELYKAAKHIGEVHLSDILFGVSIGERGMAVLLDEALGIFDHYSEIPS
ncbi:MAG: hypothetical protein SCALA702_01990 [Melioribacteraceae bacterium]|nr:MAG: hypothetical protein SCALA702_01990 [Melioribacteraceae bacterium]